MLLFRTTPAVKSCNATHICRGQNRTSVLFLWFPPYFLKTGSLSSLIILDWWPRSPRNPPTSTSQVSGLQLCTATTGFLHKYWRSKLKFSFSTFSWLSRLQPTCICFQCALTTHTYRVQCNLPIHVYNMSWGLLEISNMCHLCVRRTFVIFPFS